MWSGGDYLKNTTGIQLLHANIELSSNSSNGDYSLKIIRLTSSSGTSGILVGFTITEEDIGKQIIFSCDIYTPNNESYLQIYNGNYNSVTVPVNDGFYNYSLSAQVSTVGYSNCVAFMNIKDVEQYFYIDNVNMNIQ